MLSVCYSDVLVVIHLAEVIGRMRINPVTERPYFVFIWKQPSDKSSAPVVSKKEESDDYNYSGSELLAMSTGVSVL